VGSRKVTEQRKDESFLVERKAKTRGPITANTRKSKWRKENLAPGLPKGGMERGSKRSLKKSETKKEGRRSDLRNGSGKRRKSARGRRKK